MATTIKQGQTLEEVAAQTGQPVDQMEVTGGAPKVGAQVKPAPSGLRQMTPEEQAKINNARVASGLTPDINKTTQKPVQIEAPVQNQVVPNTVNVPTGKAPVVPNYGVPKQAGPNYGPGDVPIQNYPIDSAANRYGVEGAYIGGFGGTGETAVRDINNVRGLFNDFRLGQRAPNMNPTTQTERQALQLYQTYNAHKDLSGDQLLKSIVNGDITPDKNNMLWTSLYVNGQPTQAQKEAFASWQNYLNKTGPAAIANKRLPFLAGPAANTPEAVNKELDAYMDTAITDEKKTDVPTTTSAITEAPTAQDENKAITDIYNETVKSTTQENLDKAISGLVTLTGGELPKPGYEAHLRQEITAQGINGLEDDRNMYTQDLRDMEAINRQRIQAEQGKALPSGVIAGRVGEMERQQNERADATNRKLQTINDTLTSRYKVVGMLQEAYGNDYEATVKNYEQQYKEQVDLINTFSGLKKDEMTVADQIKTDARANLTIMYNAVKDGSINPEGMTPSQKADIAKMEARAGLPAGTFNQLHITAKDSIKTTSDRVDESGTRWLDVYTKGPDGTPTVESIKIGYDAKAMASVLNNESLINSRTNKTELDRAKLLGTLDGVDTLDAKKLIAKQDAQTALESYRDRMISNNENKTDIQKVTAAIGIGKLALDYDDKQFYYDPISRKYQRDPAFTGNNPFRDQADAAMAEAYKIMGVTGAENGGGGPDITATDVDAGYVGNLGSSAYKPKLAQGGIELPIATGAKGDALPDTRFDGTKLDKSNYQCGEFVNDYFGKRVMKNLLAEKRKQIATQIPTPGAAFIMNTGNQYGHTGIVERVADDKQSIQVVDVNRNNDSKVSRRTIMIDKNGKFTDKGAAIEGFTSGITKQDYGKTLESLIPKSSFLQGLMNSTTPSTPTPTTSTRSIPNL